MHYHAKRAYLLQILEFYSAYLTLSGIPQSDPLF